MDKLESVVTIGKQFYPNTSAKQIDVGTPVLARAASSTVS